MDTKKKIIAAIIGGEVLIIAGVIAFLFYINSDTVKINHQLELAQRYLLEEDYEQAIAAFEAVIEIDPKNEEAYLGIAEVYVEADDLANAVKILERGAKRTDSVEVAEMLEVHKSEIEQRAQAAQKAVEAEAAAAQAAANASQMNSREQEARALLEELKNQNPGYASEEQKVRFAEYAARMEELIANGDFDQLQAIADEWRQLIADASVKKTGYDVSIM